MNTRDEQRTGRARDIFCRSRLYRGTAMRDSPAKILPGPAPPADFCPGPTGHKSTGTERDSSQIESRDSGTERDSRHIESLDRPGIDRDSCPEMSEFIVTLYFSSGTVPQIFVPVPTVPWL